MRKPIRTEFMPLSDMPQMAEWMARLSHRNNIDTKIFEYPATKVLKASNGKPLVYLPIQSVQMLESLAINPEATPGEVSVALKDLLAIAEWEGRKAGHGELYFFCSDAETCAYAEHHGLEQIDIEGRKLKLYVRRLI